ncbi:hypothetical protein L6304_00615 [bacterium]|nr:hypothetical protein [bacterium]
MGETTGYLLNYFAAVGLGLALLIGGMVAALLAQVTRLVTHLQRIERQLKENKK